MLELEDISTHITRANVGKICQLYKIGFKFLGRKVQKFTQ